MTRKKSEDAVSPVIGIMLMLVVTVIIVAVVASFANGMVEDTETAPMAKLDVQIYSQHNVKSSVYDMDTYEQIVVDTYIPDLHVTHVSGDPIDTKDLKFTFSWEDQNEESHFSTFEYEEAGWNDELMGSGIYPPSGYAGQESPQPLAINYGAMDGAYFGAFTLERGQTMTALSVFLMQPWYSAPVNLYINNANPALDIILNNGEVYPVTYATTCPCCESENDPENSMCYSCMNAIPYASYGIMAQKKLPFRNQIHDFYNTMKCFQILNMDCKS